MPDLAVFYEHPRWFEALFAALDRRGVAWTPIRIQDHVLDLDEPAPAAVVFNRLAMSSFLRQGEHALFHSLAALDHWQGLGARVINGAGVLAYDTSKARQLSLFRRAGLAIPRTLVAHRREDLAPAAARLGYPVIVKANIGGSGAGMVRYDGPDQLADALAEGVVPQGVDGVTLVQEFLPVRGGKVFRCEVLAGRLLYALALSGAGSTFDLCPADVCLADKPTISVEAFSPPPAVAAAVERVARLSGLDVGGIEYLIDDRDGEARFFDFNAMSNFVAAPLDVLGWDPHERLVDFLEKEIAAHDGRPHWEEAARRTGR